MGINISTMLSKCMGCLSRPMIWLRRSFRTSSSRRCNWLRSRRSIRFSLGTKLISWSKRSRCFILGTDSSRTGRPLSVCRLSTRCWLSIRRRLRCSTSGRYCLARTLQIIIDCSCYSVSSYLTRIFGRSVRPGSPTSING
jgi:hypothetical protein